jgi:neutral/alkaline ceramidase-like enzyme
MRTATVIVGIINLLILCCADTQAAAPEDTPFKAGVASNIITPTEALWMAGYGARTKPAEGKLQDLYIKVLALEDAQGGKLVLLTSDLIGIPRSLSDKVSAEVKKRTGLSRERLMLSSSHTHCGPVLRDNLSGMYPLTPDQPQKIDAYTERLEQGMIETIVAALADLKPTRLSHGKGTIRFAMNRREPTPKGIINSRNPDGPVDHDVPVLRVETPEGKVRAIVFGYACHNTTLQFYQWCGDYAGFAQADIEQRHPGALALFWAGCGGDANPQPRSLVEHCQTHGRGLAEAVGDVLRRPMMPIQGSFRAKMDFISLPLGELPTKDQLSADALSKNLALRNRALNLLKTLETKGKLEDHYPYYPVQVWRLGDAIVWISLGGEVVVDYSFRLKKELSAGPPVWVTAYANDVMAYIPSARVLQEGGYEADSSMIYYGLPTRWAPALEERIVGKVHELVKATAR